MGSSRVSTSRGRVVGLVAGIAGRERPETSLAESIPTSFPSGHTAVATTVSLTLCLVPRRSHVWRWYAWAPAAGWIVAMMWSRTSLRAHWLSDVVGGLLEGVAVAALVWVAVEVVRDRRAARAAGRSARASSIERVANP
ncbi:phosphatase PAP2 family protein [Microbacterium tenebrionis]|nr:phosphatase PAP2 family protein [Microbacterium tenebrionis]